MLYAREQHPEVTQSSVMQSGYRNLGYILLVFPLIIVTGFWIPHKHTCLEKIAAFAAATEA